MRIVLVASLIAALTIPAFAQSQMNGIGGSQGAGRMGSSSPRETPEEAAKKKAEQKATDKAFSEAVKRIPVPDKKYDPWGNLRSTGDAH